MPNKARILYVDDDADLSRLVQLRLGRQGLDVSTAHSAAEALALLPGAYEIVVTDYRMPGGDGLAFIQDAKQLYPDLPIIMVSGMGELTVAVEAMKAGAIDYVIKDVNGGYLDLLPRALLRIVEEKRLLRDKAQMELALARERALSRLALDSISQGVCMFDADLRLQLCNAQFLACCEYPERLGIPGTTLEDMLRFNAERGDYGDCSPVASDALIQRKLERTRLSQNFTYERRNRSGRVFEVCSREMPDRGFVVTYTDITERKNAEHAVWLQAHYDALTGLANRSLFHELLKRHMQNAQRTGVPFGLLFVDLDGFKEVNDTHGHDKGDLLLKEVASRIRKAVRDSDVVARLGGDEFTIILPNVENEQNASLVAEKVLDTLSAPYVLGDVELAISASIGVTLSEPAPVPADELVRKADSAMYMAKRGGKGQYRAA